MSEDTDDAEKTEEPSQHKLEEYRKRGEVAYSRELNSVLVLAGTLFTIYVAGVYIFEVITAYIQWLYTLDTQKIYTDQGIKLLLQQTLVTALKASWPALFVALLISIGSQMMQIGFLFSPEVLTLKLDRINPINGVQRLFSKKSLTETLKALLKFIVIISITFAVMGSQIKIVGGFLHTDVFQSFLMGKEMAFRLGAFILLGLFVIALIDFGWEKFTYLQKLKMTKQEMKQEHKEREGNPEIKQKIRTIQREMSRKRMMAKVKTADVIVTNPTHYSVAIKYDTKNMVAPEVVAKGTDFTALRIREIAKENNIPIVENIMVARTLYKVVKVGHPVPRNLYKAVAEILAFVYRVKRKQKALA